MKICGTILSIINNEHYFDLAGPSLNNFDLLIKAVTVKL